MAQVYNTVTSYVYSTRNRLQDKVIPYRYTDEQMVDALNVALQETQRVRPDIFLDLKYQGKLHAGDLDDGYMASNFTIADISFDGSGNYDIANGTMVPIPSRYNDPVIFYMGAHLQLLDVEDTEDQRGVAFMAKFMQRLTQAQS